jgi:hypothetical protein
MKYTIDITDDYAPPPGPLTAEQYVEFVMNRAAESYKAQYKTDTVNEGVQAACDAYNAALPPAQDSQESQESAQ